MGLAPPHFGEFEPESGPGVGEKLPARGQLCFLGEPRSRSRIEIFPDSLSFIPDKAPGMGIALSDDIFSARGFMNGVTDGVTGGNLQLPQQQNGGGSEIFAMASTVLEQESAEEGFVRAELAPLFLPGAIIEISRKEGLNGSNGIGIFVLQM